MLAEDVRAELAVEAVVRAGDLLLGEDGLADEPVGGAQLSSTSIYGSCDQDWNNK
ncbi:MAG: hypothetical protein WDN31_13215 [Hyphomicrobium sp.]